MTSTALITGASGGIGETFARIFAKAGYHVVLAARSREKLEQLATELRVQQATVTVIPADLSLAAEVERIFQELQAQGIAVDVLVNNAGFGHYGFFHETSWEKEAMMIDLNMRSLTHLTKLFVQPMVQRGRGRILNVASTAAFQPGPTMAVYFATKAYVLHFSEAIANELEGTGVTVTALCPGPTESGFEKAADMEGSPLFKGRKLPSSLEVAQYGYDAMMKGKVVAIHGRANRLLATSARFAPRQLLTKLVRRMQEKGA